MVRKVRRKLQFQSFTEEHKRAMINADSVLFAVVINDEGKPEIFNDEADAKKHEKQIFLVHLQVGKMSVTVYTSAQYTPDDD